MAGGFVLALDQGTTGSTALVVDVTGAVRARGYAEVPQHYPRPGWVEHDPEDLWTTVERAATQALKTAGITGDDVAAIGITNQRETTTVWDRATSAPIHRAIVWQCRRTAAACDRLRAEGHEAMVRERTGLVLDAYFSGTKIAWILDQVPDARRRAARGQLAFGTVDTWLLWKLTRGRVHAAALRYRRHVAAVEADARPRARDRRQQRLAHAVPQSLQRRLGRAHVRAAPRAARGAADDRRFLRAVRRDVGPRLAAGRDPDRRHRGGSAGRALRPGVLQAGRGQEHLRHRLLRAGEYRRAAGDVVARAVDDDRLAHRRPHHLRAGGRGLRRRRGRTVAAPRPPDHRQRRGDRRARALRARHGRRVLRAGIRRARRPLLGSARAR